MFVEKRNAGFLARYFGLLASNLIIEWVSRAYFLHLLGQSSLKLNHKPPIGVRPC